MEILNFGTSGCVVVVMSRAYEKNTNREPGERFGNANDVELKGKHENLYSKRS